MKKINIKLIILLICVFTLGIVTSVLTISYATTTLSSKNVHYDNTNSGGSSTNVAGAIDELYAAADDKDILKKELIDMFYPIGSIYITTTDSTVSAVATRFGGTWVRYATDTTLVGYKESTNTVNATGGSKTVTLTNANLPSHTHTTPSTSLTNGVASEAGEHLHGSYYVTGSSWSGNVPAGIPAFNWNTTLIYNIGLPGKTGNSTIVNTTTSGIHSHDVTGTIPSLTTNSCTNCSSSPINVQNPYTVVYMYKRTA